MMSVALPSQKVPMLPAVLPLMPVVENEGAVPSTAVTSSVMPVPVTLAVELAEVKVSVPVATAAVIP